MGAEYLEIGDSKVGRSAGEAWGGGLVVGSPLSGGKGSHAEPNTASARRVGRWRIRFRIFCRLTSLSEVGKSMPIGKAPIEKGSATGRG